VLRNPWGKGEWKGAWSDNSAEIAEHKEEIEKYLKGLAPDEFFEVYAKNDADEDQGIFFMHYHDWRDNFSSLFINIDFPDKWTGVRFKSAWTESNSGGLPNSMDKDVLEKYAHNPQFLI
jgi:hypothetical protein